MMAAPLLIDHIETMSADDLRTHLRNAYANTRAQAQEVEMLNRLRSSMAAEIANKTRMRDEAEATARRVMLQRDELLEVAYIAKNACQVLVDECRQYGELTAQGIWQNKLDKVTTAIAAVKGSDE